MVCVVSLQKFIVANIRLFKDKKSNVLLLQILLKSNKLCHYKYVQSYPLCQRFPNFLARGPLLV
jgi:hypothetical protein